MPMDSVINFAIKASPGNPDIEMPKNSMAIENVSGFKNNVEVTSLISIFIMQ